MKRTVLAVLAVFVVWSVMDFVSHGIILASAYAGTPRLWRPMAEMKTGLMYATILVAAAVFAGIYAWFIGDKGVRPRSGTGFCSASDRGCPWATGPTP